MYKVAQSFTLRIILSFTICISLLVMPSVSLLESEVAQDPTSAQTARPRSNRPEGTFPDLEEIKGESNVRREPAARPFLQPFEVERTKVGPGTGGALANRLRRASWTRQLHARSTIGHP